MADPISPVEAALRVLVTPDIGGMVAGGPVARADRAGPVITPARLVAPEAEAAAASDVLHATAQAAVTRQDGAAPLLANVAAVLRQGATSQPLAAALGQVLQLLTPLGPQLRGVDITDGLRRSGTQLEAKLARGEPPQPDLKLALLGLKAVLARSQAPTEAEQPTKAVPVAPPPTRDGPLVAQSAPHTAHAEPARLAQQVDAALARIELLQIASTPAHEHERTRADPPWLFEIPFSTPQGATVAQFEIRRDSERASKEAERGWQVRFAIDVEPAGPVQVQAHLAAGLARVTIWAAREPTASALFEARSDLAGVLGGAEVAVYPGIAVRPLPSPGEMMDQRT